jgi:hypothetical protein
MYGYHTRNVYQYRHTYILIIVKAAHILEDARILDNCLMLIFQDN